MKPRQQIQDYIIAQNYTDRQLSDVTPSSFMAMVATVFPDMDDEQLARLKQNLKPRTNAIMNGVKDSLRQIRIESLRQNVQDLLAVHKAVVTVSGAEFKVVI